MRTPRNRARVMRKQVELIRQKVREAVLSLGEDLEEAEAVGICGSLARGEDFTDHSDIDLFVIVQEDDPGLETYLRWFRRFQKALAPLERDVSLFLYSLKALRQIVSWYVLRLATEGIILYDKGRVQDLFCRIVEKAKASGLVEVQLEGLRYWAIKDWKPGTEFELTLEDEEKGDEEHP